MCVSVCVLGVTKSVIEMGGVRTHQSVTRGLIYPLLENHAAGWQVLNTREAARHS